MRISALARLTYLANRSDHAGRRDQQVDIRGAGHGQSRVAASDGGSVGSSRNTENVYHGHSKKRVRYQEELALLLQQQQQGEVVEETNQPSVDSVQGLETVVADSNKVPDLKTLAQMYVQQYQKNADVKLSAEELDIRAEEVYQFYSQSSRAGRLEKIVFVE